MQSSLFRESHIGVVKCIGVRQLCANAEHAGRADGALINCIAVDYCGHIEAAKVPDDVENIIKSATDDII